MLTMEKVRSKIGGDICRRCINQRFHTYLQRQDCVYTSYPSRCRACKEMHYIVEGFSTASIFKRLFK